MGWRFRKSFSPIPGVRITFSPRGVSTSVGAGPARLTLGPQGAAVTTRIPGSGVAYRHRLDTPTPATPAFRQPAEPADTATSTDAAERIESAPTAELTSPGLQEFKALLARARAERQALARELKEATDTATYWSARWESWRDGWLFRRLFPKIFERRAALAEEWTARRDELREQQSLSQVHTAIDLPDSARSAYSRLIDSAARVASSIAIWDTLSRAEINRAKERSAASSSVERRRVRFGMGRCDFIAYPDEVPHFENANGGDLYFYPGFVVVLISERAFALVEPHELRIEHRRALFIEEDGVPHDAEVVSQAWRYANKDGSPDRRFKNNVAIPVAAYGVLSLTSATGVKEEYMLSNLEASRVFAEAWEQFAAVLPRDDSSARA